MAGDGFPSVFTPDEEYAEVAAAMGRAWMPGGSFKAAEHPLHPEFMDALAEDPVLDIFAPPNEPFILSSVGQGQLIETGNLPGLLIASAAFTHDAKGKSTEDRDGFLEEVAQTLQAFRQLIAGEEVMALTLVAFDGLTLRSGTRVETPWGLLRAATEIEAATTPANVIPTVVLAIERPAHFTIGEEFGPDGVDETIQERVRRAAELLPLAALLGIEREDRVSLGAVWWTHDEPTFRSGFQFWAPTGPRARRAMFFRGTVANTGGEGLTEAEERRLHEWAILLDRHYDPAIEVAARRTISALLERDAPHDALIDAVIALESLFGHGGTTEVGFRVTAAAALLLEPDSANRAELRSKLGNIYDARSKVIHGSALTDTVVSQRRDEAIDTAIKSLRALFSERPHLIADRDRGMRLILGTADRP